MSDSSEASSHRDGVCSWVPRRFTGGHEGRPDWDSSATMGGEDRRARWDQEAATAVREPEEGHAGELHFAQVCVCLCVFFSPVSSPGSASSYDSETGVLKLNLWNNSSWKSLSSAAFLQSDTWTPWVRSSCCSMTDWLMSQAMTGTSTTGQLVRQLHCFLLSCVLSFPKTIVEE